MPRNINTDVNLEDDPGGGIGNPVSPQIRSEIGRQLNGWLKREGQQVFQEAIASALQEQMPTLQENFLNALADDLPSDEEIEQMQLQEAIDAGYDPETQMFYTPEGYPYDPESGQLLEFDPQTGQPYLPGEEVPQEEYYEQEEAPVRGQAMPMRGPMRAQADPRFNAELFEMRRELEALRRQNEQLQQSYQTAEEQAEQADRESQIGRLLNAVPFANDKAAAQFRTYVNGSVFRLDDGTLVAGDPNKPLPLDKFIEAEIQASPHMVQSRPMGGSGAFAKPGMRPGVATMDQIKPFQPKEEREAVLKAAVEAFQGAQTPSV